MKKSNIVFSGIMATILMGAGAANAATVIASQGYVDRKDAEITTNLEQNYATKESVSVLDDAINNQETGLAGKVDSLDDAINNPDTGLANTVGELETVVNDPDSGLAGKVDDAVAAAGEASTKVDEIQTTVDELGTTVGDAESGLVKDVNDLGTAVGGVEATLGDETMTTTAQTVTGAINEIDADLANKEDKSNKIQEITAESTADQYPSAVAVRTALADKADASEVENITNNITNIEQTFEEITTPGTGLVDVVGDAEGGLVKDVADLQGTVGNAESGLVADVAGAVETANDASTKVDGMQTTVGELETVVGDETSGLVKDVADLGTEVDGLGTDIGNTESLATTSKEVVGAINEVEGRVDTAEGEIDALQTTVAGKADQSALTSGLALKEDTANKTAKITEENESSATLFPTIGAITEWTAQEISGLSELPPNPDLMEDGTLPGSKLESGAITTDKIAADAVTAGQIAAGAVGTEQIANGAVTGDKLGEELSAEIAGKADAENVYAKDETYTKTETEDKIKELGLPRPTADCVSDSNLCVLSVNEAGDLAWVSVTSPLE